MKNFVLVLLASISFVSCHKDHVTVVTPVQTTTVTTFTIPADSITLNPTGNAPLSAIVKFKSPIAGHTQITVAGMHGTASDVVQTFTDNGSYHSIPILGLYINYTNTVKIAVIDSKNDTAKATFTIKTLPLVNNHLPTSITVDVADLPHMESGFNLVSNFVNYPKPPQLPYMIDSFGDIRWCLDFTNNPVLNGLFYDCGINRLKDGNYRFVDQNTEKIYEIDVLGKIINTWSLGGYIFNHDLYEKPNGNFLVTVSQPGSTHPDGSPTVEDNIIEINRASGAIINNWDLKVSLDENRTALTTNTQDWLHTNGLVYDTTDNTIILSGRVQGVFKLTNNNHVKWIMGPHRDWGKNRRGEDLNKFLLTPLDAAGNKITDTAVLNGWVNASDFEWNWYQHSPRLLPNGYLMVFDNGDVRNYNNNQPHYSRAVEFNINEANMTVQQVWEYGKERGLETYSQIVSSVYYLPNTTHILFSPGYNVQNANGSGGKIVEVDYATKNVVFQASINSSNSWGFHRVQRLTIYPNGNPYTN